MVEQADAVALAVDVVVAAGLRGHQVAVTAVNGPRLVRLAALMLAELAAGRENAEESDG